MPRYNRKRLTVDIPISVHTELKRMAEKYNITLTRYILRIIIERLSVEKDFDNEK